MKRLTYRDNEGRAQWAPELLEDNTGMAGSVIRSFVAAIEDILGDEYDLDRAEGNGSGQTGGTVRGAEYASQASSLGRR